MFTDNILIFDGGIGTEFYDRGFYINRLFEELNLSAPTDVRAVHQAYIAAGANVLTTNTFSVTVPQLKKYGIEDRQAAIIEAALRLAREARAAAAKPEVSIGLSVGPIGELIEPLGPTSVDEARAHFEQVARIAATASGFELYILETFSNISELQYAIEGIRSVDTVRPILASITVTSSQVDFLRDFAQRIGTRDDVQALGLNCSQGPSDLFTVLKALRPLVTKPIVVQPNAGAPNQINGRYFYMTSPDYLAKYASRYVEAGAIGVGGCCGTSPAHIQAIARALQMQRVKYIPSGAPLPAAVQASTERPRARSWEERRSSFLGQAFRSGKKVVSVEVLAPLGPDLEKFTAQLDILDGEGVAFVNVPDGARASTRVASLHLAAYANRHPTRRLKVFPHLTTRDRNLIALQSDLLGAHVNGVNDVLVITGDPPKLGSNKDATAVYDIDSIGLTYLIDCLNRGVSPMGDRLGQPTNFGIGVASNPTAINVDLELQRWRYKVESGADFAVTQPIFDPETFLRWRDRVGATDWRPHMVGIWPLISLRNAEFLANEVPGVKVPAQIVEEMSKAGNDSAEAVRRGLDIAHKIMQRLDDACEGFCISAPLNKVDVALTLIQRRL
ncbi:MAG: bifunctional homocysteine S-methyltransferase/methylenetetrahydrofolate reductase [Bdellovibrionota bacterium]